MNHSSPMGMMLQFAFGSGSGSGSSPTSTRPSSSPDTHASGAVACKTPPQMLVLAAAAKAWWEGGRPEGWSLERHLADPTAGHSGTAQERLLAEAVAHWVRQGC